MNWSVYILECTVTLILFTGVIIIPLCRNPIWWIHDYPPDIQKEYFRTHAQLPVRMVSGPVMMKKGFALLVTLALFCGSYVACRGEEFLGGVLGQLWSVVDGGLVRLLFPGLGAVR